FSKDQPTANQYRNALDLGYDLGHIEEGVSLGSRDIKTNEDLVGVLDELRALVERTGAEAVFGAFPTPIMSALHMALDSLRPEARRVPVYAACSSFQHTCLEVGQLRLWLMDPD